MLLCAEQKPCLHSAQHAMAGGPFPCSLPLGVKMFRVSALLATFQDSFLADVPRQPPAFRRETATELFSTGG